jgi:hypothetical protein
MSTVRSALDELAADDLAGLTDRQLLDGVVDLSDDIAALEAQRLRRIGEMDRRLAFRQDGALSATSWLRNSCGMAAGAACGHVRMARSLQHMPATRSAFAAGCWTSVECARSLLLMRATVRPTSGTSTRSSSRPPHCHRGISVDSSTTGAKRSTTVRRWLIMTHDSVGGGCHLTHVRRNGAHRWRPRSRGRRDRTHGGEITAGPEQSRRYRRAGARSGQSGCPRRAVPGSPRSWRDGAVGG